eukprot:TRINITY_DN1431_c0_g2_i2.p1 TRINITY_DN1431_c0_g2~~TRINITY_DN1431_c0_g2_i2.p1  ORF type:complete len:140 (-),score=3.43 TRINITY_DN1431_c0_g2_i2:19-438(-)
MPSHHSRLAVVQLEDVVENPEALVAGISRHQVEDLRVVEGVGGVVHADVASDENEDTRASGLSINAQGGVRHIVKVDSFSEVLQDSLLALDLSVDEGDHGVGLEKGSHIGALALVVEQGVVELDKGPSNIVDVSPCTLR